MSKKYAILVLEGPLQSWGLQGKFDRRDSANLPTKSGVVGLICAALGIARDDQKSIALISSLEMKVYTIKRGNSLCDYHTIGGGHIDKEGIVPRARGNSKNTVVTRRYYLSEASFAVVF